MRAGGGCVLIIKTMPPKHRISVFSLSPPPSLTPLPPSPPPLPPTYIATPCLLFGMFVVPEIVPYCRSSAHMLLLHALMSHLLIVNKLPSATYYILIPRAPIPRAPTSFTATSYILIPRAPAPEPPCHTPLLPHWNTRPRTRRCQAQKIPSLKKN
jgi:hypothetical protein